MVPCDCFDIDYGLFKRVAHGQAWRLQRLGIGVLACV